MSPLNYFPQLVRNQLGYLRRWLTGRPVTTPPLSYATVGPDDLEICTAFLEKKQAWDAPEVVAEYENTFAGWNGSGHAYAFMGGRVALSACIHALGLGPGDEVIVPAYTCVVVPNAFAYAGVDVAYCDIELDTYGLDAELLEERITSKTRAVLVQHLYGLVCRDYEAILALAKRFNLRVIEDCAHAAGAEYRGVKMGNRGDVGFYSSEQSKLFTTYQGGLAVTSDPELATGLAEYKDQAPDLDEASIERFLRMHLMNYKRYRHPGRWLLQDMVNLRQPGPPPATTTEEEMRGIKPVHYGCRMPAPIAALGLNQLRKLDGYNRRRRRTARRWAAWCDNNGYKKPVEIEGSIPVYLRYPVLVEPEMKQDRSWALKDPGVAVGVWYRSHIHPTGRRLEGFPVADTAVERCVNFPCVLD